MNAPDAASSAVDKHLPLAVLSVDGMPFVHCSCRDDMKPQTAVWLSEHWQGTEDEGVAALDAVVARQRSGAPRPAERFYREPASDPARPAVSVEDVLAAHRLCASAYYQRTDQWSASCLADGCDWKARGEMGGRDAAEAAHRAHVAAALAEAGIGVLADARTEDGAEAAARLIASVAWPFEQQEARESWAPRLLNEPDFLEQEYRSAVARLRSAYAKCFVAARAARAAAAEQGAS